MYKARVRARKGVTLLIDVEVEEMTIDAALEAASAKINDDHELCAHCTCVNYDEDVFSREEDEDIDYDESEVTWLNS